MEFVGRADELPVVRAGRPVRHERPAGIGIIAEQGLVDEGGTSVRLDAHAALGEAIFAPRTGGTDELDGYYLAYAGDLATDHTSLLVIDADDFAAGPVATVHLPRRVPNGLHGSWFPAG